MASYKPPQRNRRLSIADAPTTILDPIFADDDMAGVCGGCGNDMEDCGCDGDAENWCPFCKEHLLDCGCEDPSAYGS